MLRRWRDGEDGAVAVLTAVIFLALVAASAVAVDVGRLAVVSRDQQGATDRAALDAVYALRDAPGDLATVTAASLAANRGFWERVSSTPAPDGRCAAATPVDGVVPHIVEPVRWDPMTETWSNAEPFNAVRVVTCSSVGSLFLPDSERSEVEREAIAMLTEPLGTISATSRLAGLGDGAINDLLELLLPGAVDLSLLSWEGLADVGLDLAVLATELGVGTATELLETTVDVGQLIGIAADAFPAGSDPAVAAAIAQLVNLTVPTGSFALGDILALDTDGEAGLAGAVDLLSLITAGLFAANGDSGIGLDADALGLPVRLAVTRPPQVAVGPARSVPVSDDHPHGFATVARSAQVQLEIDLPIGVPTQPGAISPEDADAFRQDIQTLRNRIDDELTTCLRAIGSRGRDIRDDIQSLTDTVRDRGSAGLLGGLVGGLLDGVGSLLGGVLEGLGCVLAPNTTRDGVKTRLHNALDDLAEAVELGAATAVGTSTEPTLTIQLASAVASVTDVTCPTDAEDQAEIGIQTTTSGAVVRLPTTRLLNLELGPLGSLGIEVGIDAPLVHSDYPAEPFAVPSSRNYPAGSLNLGAALAGITPRLTPGSEVLGLPLDAIANPLLTVVSSALSEVLGQLDDLVLDDLVQLLDRTVGLSLADASVGAIDVTRCGGRQLVS